MSDERVLCVPSVWLKNRFLHSAPPGDMLEAILGVGEYIPRSQCETDENYRQLLPYIVVRCNGLILAYQRAGTETRLDGLWSIGVGGHVNDEDGDWYGGVFREIYEELSGLPKYNAKNLHGPLGFLRDDSNAVGRVHLGVLYTLDVPDVNAVHMTECADYVWEAANCLDVRNLENWSRMALDMLKGN